MPELPEVETVRKSLQVLVVGKTINKVEVRLPRIIRTPADARAFEFMMESLTITEVSRRGKFLLIHVPPYILVSHLRMEGRFGLYAKEDPIEKHTHVIFHFTDQTELRYKDVRQFGTMDLLTPGTLHQIEGLRTMGPEPLSEEFKPEVLWSLLQKKNRNLKAALLDQSFLAGLGNIYVDEALFEAGLHPETLCGLLTKEECKRLYDAIRRILSASVEVGGSSVKSYVNGYGQTGGFQFHLQVYAREGAPCVKCGTQILKTRVAGRGTHLCSQCQPKPGGKGEV